MEPVTRDVAATVPRSENDFDRRSVTVISQLGQWFMHRCWMHIDSIVVSHEATGMAVLTCASMRDAHILMRQLHEGWPEWGADLSFGDVESMRSEFDDSESLKDFIQIASETPRYMSGHNG